MVLIICFPKTNKRSFGAPTPGLASRFAPPPLLCPQIDFTLCNTIHSENIWFLEYYFAHFMDLYSNRFPRVSVELPTPFKIKLIMNSLQTHLFLYVDVFNRLGNKGSGSFTIVVFLYKYLGNTWFSDLVLF